MRFPQAFVAVLGGGAAVASAIASPVGTPGVVPDPLDHNVALPAEKAVLTEADVADCPELRFGEELGKCCGAALDRRAQSKPMCKVIPGDRLWPSKKAWSILNLFVHGQLVKPAPIGSVCYPGSAYNAALCANITAEWANSDTQ